VVFSCFCFGFVVCFHFAFPFLGTARRRQPLLDVSSIPCLVSGYFYLLSFGLDLMIITILNRRLI
jgi:hypothetical protein